MAVYCANDYYCISNTGFSTLDDNYTQSGTYNLRDYFVGGTNGYYIYFTGSLWCLSDTLGGSCFLQGKYPYSGLCPDLSTSYVNATVCATPTPTQTIGCGNLSFDAIFEINITNTPSVTPTMTRTPTITPSVTITNFCPFIGVSASVSYISPTPTPTITPTPKTVAQRNRAPIISCSFNGDVTFTTVNSVISCPVSRQFQDCSTGFIYRTSSSVTNPSGGDFSQFMIFEGLVDGVYRCVTYLGLDSNNQAGNQITLQVGPIGYSNLGQCNLCFNAGTLTPTPTPTLTPTPTVTPSAGLCLGLCSVLYISFDNQQIYTLDLGSFSYQPLPFSNVGVSSDIAHTANRVFASTINEIRVWNISLCPFSSSYVKQVLRTPGAPPFGSGLFAINDNTLLTWNSTSGLSPRPIIRINLTPNLDTINASNINELFSLPIGREPFGDLILTNNNKLIIFNRDSDNDAFISQFVYPTGGSPEVDIPIPQSLGLNLSLFVNNNQIYIIDADGLVYSIDNVYPYTITEYFNFGFNQVGTSQIQSCINIDFIPFTPQVTYYVYKLCNDTVGPQTYVYQTEPSLATVGTQTIFNLTNNTCWQYDGSSTTIPQNTTDDIIVYQGNYFTEVANTVYNNCIDCLTNTTSCCCYSATGPTINAAGSITFVNCGTEYGVFGETVTIQIQRYRIINFCSSSIISTNGVTYEKLDNCTNCRDGQTSPSSPANCVPPKQCKCMAFKNTSSFNVGQLPQVTYKKCSGQIVTVDVSQGTTQAHCDCVDLTYTIDNDNDIEIQECESGNPEGNCSGNTFINSNRCCCQATCDASGAVPPGAVVIPSCT